MLRRRTFVVVLACLSAVAAGLAATIYLLSGVRLGSDGVALARVRLKPFAGSLVGVRATTSDGRSIPLTVDRGRIVPGNRLTPGEQATVTVVVRRPGWSAWALGKEQHERLIVQAPVATIVQRWLTVAPGRRPVVRFDKPVSTVTIGGTTTTLDAARVEVPTRLAGGTVRVAAAARPWERPGPAVTVTWFPKAARPVVLTHPASGSEIEPLATIRLTFSEPVSSVVSHVLPSLTPTVAGRWTRTDSHTLLFHPSGFGAPFNTVETLRLPKAVTILGSRSPTHELSWHIAPASFLRLQQLLAGEGYLPLSWTPADVDVATTRAAELAAATSPPDGRFHWTYPNTPRELQSLWHAGEPDEITRGAVMMFEHDHKLPVDGIAGPHVWRAAIADAVTGKRKPDGYSYVYVHRNLPQLLTLWHNGKVVLTSPGNTGVPAAPTQLGTWPVFEHIPIGRMSGTNPDGSHYNDPGIHWISYFHEGEALHAFNRTSFGTPQSLGCVELPLTAAAKVWPYTPIGTLVTIED